VKSTIYISKVLFDRPQFKKRSYIQPAEKNNHWQPWIFGFLLQPSLRKQRNMWIKPSGCFPERWVAHHRHLTGGKRGFLTVKVGVAVLAWKQRCFLCGLKNSSKFMFVYIFVFVTKTSKVWMYQFLHIIFCKYGLSDPKNYLGSARKAEGDNTDSHLQLRCG